MPISIELARENIGAEVIYRPHPWFGFPDDDEGPSHTEKGTIHRVTENFVFVNYSGRIRATYPEDLSWKDDRFRI